MSAELLAFQLRALGLPAPVREFRFHDDRKWRADFTSPNERLIVEFDRLFDHDRGLAGPDHAGAETGARNTRSGSPRCTWRGRLGFVALAHTWRPGSEAEDCGHEVLLAVWSRGAHWYEGRIVRELQNQVRRIRRKAAMRAHLNVPMEDSVSLQVKAVDEFRHGVLESFGGSA